MSSTAVSLESIAQAWSGFMWAMSWQCGVVVAAVWLLTLCARRARASLRYALWCLVLAKLLLLPSFRLPMGLGEVAQKAGLRVDLSQQVRAIPDEPRRVVHSGVEADRRGEMTSASPTHVTSSPAPQTSPTVWLFLGWAGAGAALALGLLAQHCRLRLAVRSAQEPEQTGLVTLFRECLAAAGVRSRVEVKVADSFPGPAAVGVWRPTVLLPRDVVRDVGADAEALRPILLHELAHVRRGDLWVNWLQTLLQIVYFFHPGVWLANYFLRREREKACDEQVLAWLGYDSDPSTASRSYAQILLRVVELMPCRTPLALGFVSVAEPRSVVADRIREILKDRSRLVPRLGLFGLLAVAAIASVILPLAAQQAGSRPPQQLPVHEPVGTMPMPTQPESIVEAGDGNTTYVAQLVDRGTGQPLAAVRAALHPGGRRQRVTATTDRTGRFAVVGLTPGRYSLHHEAQDYVRPHPRITFTLVEDKGETAARIIRLDRGATVRGVALRPNGKPAVGVPLSVDVKLPRYSYGGYARATTDGEGRFELRGMPACVLTITPQGGEQQYGVWIETIALGELHEHVVLQLHERNVTVTGTVVDVTGAPVEKANAVLWTRIGSNGPFSAYTKADGSFVIERAVPGAYRLQASLESSVHSDSLELALKDGERAGPFTLKLRDSVSRGPQGVRGRVVDLEGQPIPDARVCILSSSVRRDSFSRSHSFGRWSKTRTVTVGETGSFALEVKGSAYTHHALLADAPGFGPVSLDGVKAGAQDVLFELRPDGVLNGWVTSAETGRPLAETPIRLACVHITRHGSSTHVRRDRSLDKLTRTDADGHYNVEGLAAGEYKLEVAMDGATMQPSGAVRVESGQTASFDWQARAYAQRTITVVDAADGRPIAGAELRGSGNVLATTNAEGLARLSEKRYHTLHVRAAGYVPLEIYGVPITSGPGLPKSIELMRAARLSVQVRDERDRPLAEVWVHVKLLDKKPQHLEHPQSRPTGPDGAVVFDSLPPGLKLQLSAEPKGCPRSFSTAIKLKPGAQNPEAKIVVRPGGTLRVRVVDTGDREIPRVHMGVTYRLAWRKYSGWSAKPYAGQQPFVIRGVATKPFRLIVRADGFTEASVDEDAVGIGETRDLAVRLGAGNILRGTLTDAKGKPRPDVRLRIWTHSSGEVQAGNTVTDQKGNFSMQGLSTGQVQFNVDSSPWFALQPQNGTPRFSAASGQSLSIRLLGTPR